MEFLFPSWLMSIAAFVLAYRYVGAVRHDIRVIRDEAEAARLGVQALLKQVSELYPYILESDNVTRDKVEYLTEGMRACIGLVSDLTPVSADDTR